MLRRCFSVLLLVLTEFSENRGFLCFDFFLFRCWRYRLFGTVVDNTINHAIIIFQLHFRIFQMVVGIAEVCQFLIANAVNIVIGYHTRLFECHDVTDREAVSREVLRMLDIENTVQILQLFNLASFFG